MNDRIERKHSYSMNREEKPAAEQSTPDEATEFTRIKLPTLRKRIQGEALVKFGPPRRQQKPALSQSSAPFDLLPRGTKPRKLVAFEVRVVTPGCPAGEPMAAVSVAAADAPVVPLQAKKQPRIGQEIRLDGKLAIITWLGETKFEVAVAGREAKMRLKYSDYPDLKRGACEIQKVKSEPSDVAS